MHFGEVVFNFQDENSFLVNYPETAKASGKIACRFQFPGRELIPGKLSGNCEGKRQNCLS